MNKWNYLKNKSLGPNGGGGRVLDPSLVHYYTRCFKPWIPLFLNQYKQLSTSLQVALIYNQKGQGLFINTCSTQLRNCVHDKERGTVPTLGAYT